MRRSTACILLKKTPLLSGALRFIRYELSSRALDRDYSAPIGGEAGDQLRALFDVGTELRRDGLAHAERLDLVRIGALADEVGPDALGAPLGKLLIVLRVAQPVGMHFDDDGLDARAGRELRDHVAVQSRLRRLRELRLRECENLLVLESHRGIAARGNRRGSGLRLRRRRDLAPSGRRRGQG